MASSLGPSRALKARLNPFLDWAISGRETLFVAGGVILTTVLVYLAVFSGSPLMAVALFAGVVVALLMIIKPVLGLYALILSVPIQDVGAVSIAGTNLTATKVVVVVALAAWFLRRLTLGQIMPLRAPLSIPFITLLIAMALSVLAARSLGAAFSELFRWVEAFLVYIIAADLINTRRRLVILVGAILVGPTIEALYGLYQFATGAGPESFAISDSLSRAFGTFGMPNSYAGFLGMGYSMALSLFFFFVAAILIGVVTGRWPVYGEGKKSMTVPARFFWTVFWGVLTFGLVALILGGIFASLSRGAWVGLIAGMGVMVLASGRRLLIPVISILALLFLLIASGHSDILPSILTERFTSVASELRLFDVRQVMVTPENFAVVERMAQWQTGSSMFLNNPFLGVGIGNYNAAYPEYFIFPWINSPGHAHNYYIHIAAETGIVGLLAYLFLIITAFVHGFGAVKRTPDPLLRAIAIGALGILGATAAHNVFENLHVLSMGIQWASVLAIFAIVPLLPQFYEPEGRTAK